MGKNCRSFDTYSPEELREAARLGGLRSGETRRKKRERIEREKIENQALAETRRECQRQHIENIRTIRDCCHILAQSQGYGGEL